MKNFKEFIYEARVTNASKKAHELGLFGDGHGYWVDKSGQRKGKTVRGEFQPLGKKPDRKEPIAPAPPPQEVEAAPKQVQEPLQQRQPKQAPAPEPAPQAPPEEAPVDQGDGTIVLVFGRFNPPTIGHERLLDSASTIASNNRADLRVYPSRSEDPRKNPLKTKTKIEYMRKMFPDFQEYIYDDKKIITIFDALGKVNQEGFTNVILVVGRDRVNEFANLANKYNGQFYNFENIEVESAGDRDPDADGLTGMSASKCRKYAADDDFKGFRTCIPRSLGDDETEDLFRDVQRGMNIRPYQKHLYKEDFDIWKIAPKLDLQSLREEYKQHRIYPVGCLVENLNTGITGRIIRRGTNYVICLANEGVVFKSWITDITEVNHKI